MTKNDHWNNDHFGGTIAALRKMQLERMTSQVKAGGSLELEVKDEAEKTEGKSNEGKKSPMTDAKKRKRDKKKTKVEHVA